MSNLFHLSTDNEDRQTTPQFIFYSSPLPSPLLIIIYLSMYYITNTFNMQLYMKYVKGKVVQFTNDNDQVTPLKINNT